MSKEKKMPQEALDALPKGWTAFWGSEERADYSREAYDKTLCWGNGVWDNSGWNGLSPALLCARPDAVPVQAESDTPIPEPTKAQLSDMLARAVAPVETCEWKGNDDGVWQGSCGVQWLFTNGGPTGNRMGFCFKCGKPIKVVSEEKEQGS